MTIDPCTTKERAFQATWTQAEEAEYENFNRRLQDVPEEVRLVVLSNAATLAITGILGANLPEAIFKYLLPAIDHDAGAVVEVRPLEHRLRAVASRLLAFHKLYNAGHRDDALWRNIILGLEMERAGLGSPNTGNLIELALRHRRYPHRC